MYRLTNDPDSVLRLSDNTLIPNDHRWWGEYEQWIADGNQPEPAPDTRAAEGRAKRDGLLRSTDWTQLADTPLSAIDKQKWNVYRTALRLLPSQPGFPDVQWPKPPELIDGAADAAVFKKEKMP